MTNTLARQINITIYFQNLTIKLHVQYIFKTHVKFHINRMLFTIHSINLFFMYNFRLQKFGI